MANNNNNNNSKQKVEISQIEKIDQPPAKQAEQPDIFKMWMFYQHPEIKVIK